MDQASFGVQEALALNLQGVLVLKLPSRAAKVACLGGLVQYSHHQHNRRRRRLKKKRIVAPRPRHGEDGPPRFSDQELEEQLASRQEDSGGMSVS